MHRLPQLARLLVSSFTKTPFLSKNQQQLVISDTQLKLRFFSASNLDPDAKVGSSHSGESELDKIKNSDVVEGQEKSVAESSLASESTVTKAHITHQQSTQSSSFNLEDRDMTISEGEDSYNNNHDSPSSNPKASLASCQKQQEESLQEVTSPTSQNSIIDRLRKLSMTDISKRDLEELPTVKPRPFDPNLLKLVNSRNRVKSYGENNNFYDRRNHNYPNNYQGQRRRNGLYDDDYEDGQDGSNYEAGIRPSRQEEAFGNGRPQRREYGFDYEDFHDDESFDRSSARGGRGRDRTRQQREPDFDNDSEDNYEKNIRTRFSALKRLPKDSQSNNY